MALPVVAAWVGSKLFEHFLGQHRDSMQYKRQMKLDDAERKFNAEEAQKQRQASFSSAMALQRQQENYNSEQAQVSRLKQAGLNPALLYGGATSSSSIASAPQSAASSSAGSASASSVGSGTVSDSILQQAQIDNLNKNTESQQQDVVSKETNNKYLEQKIQNDLRKQIAEIDNIIENTELTKEERENLIALREATIKKLLSEATKNLAESDYISGAQTDLARAREETEGTIQDLNAAKSKTEKSQDNLNKEQAETEKTKRRLQREQAKTEKTKRILNAAEAAFKGMSAKEIKQRYNLKDDEIKLFTKYCKKLGIPKGFVKGILGAYGSFTEGVGKGVSEFFSGNTWLNFINDRYRTDQWSKPQNGSDESPATSQNEVPQNSQDVEPAEDKDDVAKTVPSNTTLMHHIQQLDKSEPFPKEFRENYNKQYKWLFEQAQKHNELDKMKKDLYYNTQTTQQFMEKWYYYGYKYKYND